MAQLLSEGATMLSKPCPRCDAPLFRTKDGRVVCASCGYSPEQTVVAKPAEEKRMEPRQVTRSELNEILNEKMSLLVAALKESKDPGEIRDIVSSIREILALLEEK